MVCSSSILHSSLIPHSFVTLQTDYLHSLGISSKVKMRGSTSWAFTAVASVAVVHAVTLNDVCTSFYVQASLPSDGFYQGTTINPSSALVNPVTNTQSATRTCFRTACSIIAMSHSHTRIADEVIRYSSLIGFPLRTLSRAVTSQPVVAA